MVASSHTFRKRIYRMMQKLLRQRHLGLFCPKTLCDNCVESGGCQRDFWRRAAWYWVRCRRMFDLPETTLNAIGTGMRTEGEDGCCGAPSACRRARLFLQLATISCTFDWNANGT